MAYEKKKRKYTKRAACWNKVTPSVIVAFDKPETKIQAYITKVEEQIEGAKGKELTRWLDFRDGLKAALNFYTF